MEFFFIIGGALALGYLALKGNPFSSSPTLSGATASKGPLPTPAGGGAVSVLQGMVNALQLQPNGALPLNTKITDDLNKILTYMKQNPTSHAVMPASVANWLVGRGIDFARTAQ